MCRVYIIEAVELFDDHMNNFVNYTNLSNYPLTKILLFTQVAQVDIDLLRFDLRVHLPYSRRRPPLGQMFRPHCIIFFRRNRGFRTFQKLRFIDAREFLDLWEEFLREVGAIMLHYAVVK